MTDAVGELDSRYSEDGVPATSWSQAKDRLAGAELYWLSTVRPDGRPHVTPLVGVWLDRAMYFGTGPEERKARNLLENPYCVFTTGTNLLREGLDVVLEGEAVRVTDEEKLRRVADAYDAKYGSDWHFEVRDKAFHHPAGAQVLVYEVTPVTAFGFGKGEYSQTRWRFR